MYSTTRKSEKRIARIASFAICRPKLDETLLMPNAFAPTALSRSRCKPVCSTWFSVFVRIW